MHPKTEQLKEAIAPARLAVTNHALYNSIKTLEDLQLFTQYHVFAVWDFMSLLKGLQRNLTCVEYPWVPVGNANTRYLINEIVTGEESDVDEEGQRCSHYELYIRAMEQMGASTAKMGDLMSLITSGVSVQDAIVRLELAPAVREFVQFTFDTLDQNDAAVTAAVFTFGREDLIPDMFVNLVRDLEKQFPGQVSIYKYYLERHIEVDGGHHGHLSLEMVEALCGDDAGSWERATAGAMRALELRKLLWDGALEAICQKNSNFVL